MRVSEIINVEMLCKLKDSALQCLVVRRWREFKFMYLAPVLWEYLERRERLRGKKQVQGRQVIGTLCRIIKGRSVNVDMKRGLRSTVIPPTPAYYLKTDTR